MGYHKVKPEKRKKVGAPSIYTKKLAQKICAQLAEGISLRTVCLADDMPSKTTVFKWLSEKQEFVDQYARAKQESADALVEEMIDIADDGTNDWMTMRRGKDEIEVENKEATGRSRLRIDTRKWIASKLKPKKYGSKMDVTSDGKQIGSVYEALTQATKEPSKED